MDNDMEREAKQNYLRENILEKEYDTNKFLEYLVSVKGENAHDVDVWTMDELMEVVENFIKESTTPAYHSDEEKKKETPVKEEPINMPQNVLSLILDQIRKL